MFVRPRDAIAQALHRLSAIAGFLVYMHPDAACSCEFLFT